MILFYHFIDGGGSNDNFTFSGQGCIKFRISINKKNFRAFWSIQLGSLYLINEITATRELCLNTTQHGES
jgi:hypothetical protein